MSFPLVPLPSIVQPDAGTRFTLDESTHCYVDDDARAAVEIFATGLRRATGLPLAVTAEATAPPPESPAATFRVDTAADFGEHSGHGEAYRIEITRATLTVVGASAHGVFNATQTLRQLLPAGVEADSPVLADWHLPGVTIVDGPAFDYRGVMIDVARSFLTVPEMEQIIDLLALAKFSRLHLHLSDDQGWRIEITNDGRVEGDTIDYTRLTGVSGRTAMSEWAYRDEPGRSGYYTQDDYCHLVAYAAERHIVVVPEIDLPGHTNAALAAIGELNTSGSSHEGSDEQPTSAPDGSGAVGHTYLDPHSDHTYIFIRHVLRQLADLTPGEYLHIGGDEPLDMTKRYGHEGYIDCVARIVEIVRDVGKKPAGWNEVAEAKAGADMIVQFWHGETDHTLRAVSEGAKVLLSHGERGYLDQKYHPDTPVGLDWACTGDCDFPAYYSWQPTELVPGLEPESIVGVEAPLWSETLRGVSQVLFMVFPRAYAIAELGWTVPECRNLGDFTSRLGVLAPRLLMGGGNFYDGPKTTWMPAVVGIPATVEGGPEVIAVVVAPGGKKPTVSVTLEGQDVPVVLTASEERSALRAGPIYAVVVRDDDARALGSEELHGRITVGQASAPLHLTIGRG